MVAQLPDLSFLTSTQPTSPPGKNNLYISITFQVKQPIPKNLIPQPQPFGHSGKPHHAFSTPFPNATTAATSKSSSQLPCSLPGKGCFCLTCSPIMHPLLFLSTPPPPEARVTSPVLRIPPYPDIVRPLSSRLYYRNPRTLTNPPFNTNRL